VKLLIFIFIFSYLVLNSEINNDNYFTEYENNPFIFTSKNKTQKLIISAIDDIAIIFTFINTNGDAKDTISGVGKQDLFSAKLGTESDEYNGKGYFVREYWYKTENCCSMSFRISLEDKICYINKVNVDHCPELQKIKEEFLFLEPRKEKSKNPNSRKE